MINDTRVERPQLVPTSVMGWRISFGQMEGKPATTPQALRDQAERSIRLAHGTLDMPAKAALLALAEELQQKATQLEAAVPTEAPTPTETPIARLKRLKQPPSWTLPTALKLRRSKIQTDFQTLAIRTQIRPLRFKTPKARRASISERPSQLRWR